MCPKIHLNHNPFFPIFLHNHCMYFILFSFFAFLFCFSLEAMKASIKFPENSKPIMRAKVPVTILGLPFRTGVQGSSADDLCFSFSSFFQSGPLFKLLYRPYDSFKPFSVILKTGLGIFGSPFSAPLTVSAELNVLGDAAPSFLLNFRPRVGDFSVRRSVLSDPDFFSDDDDRAHPVPRFNGLRQGSLGEKLVSLDEGEAPEPTVIEDKRGFSGKRTAEKVFAGVEVSARTLLPVRDQALLKFRWRLKLPETKSGAEQGFIPYGIALPCLALSKIGIEHVASNRGMMKPDEVAEACLAIKRELQVLQVERGNLRNAVDELRVAICPVKLQPVAGNQTSGKEFESGSGKFFSVMKPRGEKKETENSLIPATITAAGNAKSGTGK